MLLDVSLSFLGVHLQKCVTKVCEALINNEEKLNELDRGSGDGDCGTTLKAGAIGRWNDAMIHFATGSCSVMMSVYAFCRYPANSQSNKLG